jgi:hypothetical protein
MRSQNTEGGEIACKQNERVSFFLVFTYFFFYKNEKWCFFVFIFYILLVF